MSSDTKPSDIFECIQCGECCKGYGGTYITEKDILAISEYLHTDPARFVKECCQMSGSKPVLAVGENGYCLFWQDKRCGIHPVKPKMCRAWPFIQSVLTDISNWRIMAASCPGIRTDIPDDEIRKCVSREVRKSPI